MEKRCYILGAGDFTSEVLPAPGDFVIAADAGLTPLRERGIVPDLIVGDFDSMGEVPEGENVLRHPVMKDDTDMALALWEAWDRGYRRFTLNGGLGGRLDHTLANIQLLHRAALRGGEVTLVGPKERLTVLRNGTLCFPAAARGIVSVFCLGAPAQGVTIDGLLYSLRDAVLTDDRALGVSNEFTGAPSSISVREGCLLVVWRDGSLPDRG